VRSVNWKAPAALDRLLCACGSCRLSDSELREQRLEIGPGAGRGGARGADDLGRQARRNARRRGRNDRLRHEGSIIAETD